MSISANCDQLNQLKQDILDIVCIAQRNGAADMTADEIQRVYEERVVNRRVKDGPFAGRISEMAQAGLLLPSSTKRQSHINGGTGPRKNAYRVPSSAADAPRAAQPAASATSYY